VANFAKLARDNLKLSGGVLQSVGTPIKVQQTIVKGGHTPLDSFAVAIAVTVSLMFVTLLLASGVLALEREENAFLRLVRGLVSRTGLLVEKVGLAAVCAMGVSLVMLAGIALFVSLEWGRFPLWLLGLGFGALAFGAMGVAIGGVTREVRAASLLAFMVSLPLAFLALVPSGSVSEGLYDVIRVISALFPFKPTLEAMNSALNRSGGIVGPLVHLAILTLAFGVIARLSLRRFA
jgi:ABC-2 type transport system permease protein